MCIDCTLYGRVQKTRLRRKNQKMELQDPILRHQICFKNLLEESINKVHQVAKEPHPTHPVESIPNLIRFYKMTGYQILVQVLKNT